MEYIQSESGMAKGTEILYFDNCEVRKFKGNSTSWASAGPLKVLYFKDYMRFVLELNDWKYPLLRRLPVTTAGQGQQRSYTFPALNGFSYELRLSNVSGAGLQNFETILSNCSNWSAQGVERKLEASPEDKLVRKIKKETEEHGPITSIGQTLKQAGQAIKTKVATMQTGTKNLTSTKKRINLKEIKNKNFKKSAKPTFKTNYFKNSEKLSSDFYSMRKNNPFLTGSKEWNDIRKATNLPSTYVFREDIEECILNNKDLASQAGYSQGQEPKKGFMDNLKQGLLGDRSRDQPRTVGEKGQPTKTVGLEGMTHLSG